MVSSKKTPDCQSTKSRQALQAVLGAGRARKSTKGKQRPTYRRRVKPPYSYAELITMAIKSSPTSMLTLREILDHMAASYECFRGLYVGWKNSVRHNLSANDCFVKVLRNSQRPYGKDNFWTLNASCPHCLGAGEGSVGNASPDQSSCPPPTRPPTSQQAHRSNTDSSSPPLSGGAESFFSISEEATAPYLSSPASTTSYGQSSRVSSWPSPTPGRTPGIGSPAPAGQTSDEWSFLEDLFVPDTDIDPALYGDVLELAASNQPAMPIPSRPRFGSAGQGPYPVSLVKTEPLSHPDCLDTAYSSYQPVPRGTTERQSAFLPYVSSFSTTVNIKAEYTSACCSSTFSYGVHHHEHRPSSPGFGKASAGCREEAVPAQYETSPHRFGSIVASAIRGSLSLDLEESALLAIERSVRLLDQTRPGDLTCA